MKILDLFSGIGGISLGLERAGMTTVAFCEQDEYCQRVLRKHWPTVPIYDDVRTLDGTKFKGIDVVAGGSPCQDISTAGSGGGINGERSGLWGEFARIISESKPRFVFFENVAAIRSRGLDRVLQDLWAVGYDAEWHVAPASAFGAPHQRERLWLIAYAQRLGLPRPGQYRPPLHPAPHDFREADRLVHAVQQGSLPFMCGRHDGVSTRVGRPAVKALGNSVVPQAVEYFGRIMQAIKC